MTSRPRWHDVVISLWILALTGAGIAAIWGDSIASLWVEETAQRDVSEPPTEPSAGPML